MLIDNRGNDRRGLGKRLSFKYLEFSEIVGKWTVWPNFRVVVLPILTKICIEQLGDVGLYTVSS